MGTRFDGFAQLQVGTSQSDLSQLQELTWRLANSLM